MEEFDNKLNKASKEKLDELKIWLFRENVRIQAERREIDEKYELFEQEKKQFQEEMKQTNQRMQAEQKKLKKEQALSDKKLAILQDAYKQLDHDKKVIEKEKNAIVSNKGKRHISKADYLAVESYFRGVTSVSALKKRYKELLKIFHPDNLCGDADVVQLINKEYDMLHETYQKREHT
ncbi:MAG: hypothetical protein RRX92_03290 [Lachnospiraceae bacterium]